LPEKSIHAERLVIKHTNQNSVHTLLEASGKAISVLRQTNYSKEDLAVAKGLDKVEDLDRDTVIDLLKYSRIVVHQFIITIIALPKLLLKLKLLIAL
jgi:hypothetical protein